jgi:hypothetical protein
MKWKCYTIRDVMSRQRTTAHGKKRFSDIKITNMHTGEVRVEPSLTPRQVQRRLEKKKIEPKPFIIEVEKKNTKKEEFVPSSNRSMLPWEGKYDNK